MMPTRTAIPGEWRNHSTISCSALRAVLEPSQANGPSAQGAARGPSKRGTRLPGEANAPLVGDNGAAHLQLAV